MADPVVLKFPVNFTPGEGANDVYKPVVNCPELWGPTCHGRNLSGQHTPPAPEPTNENSPK